MENNADSSNPRASARAERGERVERDIFDSRFFSMKKFSGQDPNFKWPEFRHRLTAILDPNATEKTKLRVFMQLLTGDAEVFFDANRKFTTCPFDEVLNAFEKRFTVPPITAQAEFRSAVQAETESVNAYASRVQLLTNSFRPSPPSEQIVRKDAQGRPVLGEDGQPVMIANPTYAAEESFFRGQLKQIADTRIQQFLNGLKAEVFSELGTLRFDSWEAAVDAAIIAEEKSAAKRDRFMSNAAVVDSRFCAAVNALDIVTSRLETLQFPTSTPVHPSTQDRTPRSRDNSRGRDGAYERDRDRNRDRSRPANNDRAYERDRDRSRPRHHERGHNRSHQTSNGVRRPPLYEASGPRCYHCNRMGHMVKDCRQKARFDQEQNQKITAAVQAAVERFAGSGARSRGYDRRASPGPQPGRSSRSASRSPGRVHFSSKNGY